MRERPEEVREEKNGKGERTKEYREGIWVMERWADRKRERQKRD